MLLIRKTVHGHNDFNDDIINIIDIDDDCEGIYYGVRQDRKGALVPVFNASHMVSCPDAPVVHASGSGQLRANPHVAGPWLSPGKSTRRAVTTLGSNDLVVGEDHMLGPSCQRYNWQAGRYGSIALGSSPWRGKTLISNPRCLAEVFTCGKDFRR